VDILCSACACLIKITIGAIMISSAILAKNLYHKCREMLKVGVYVPNPDIHAALLVGPENGQEREGQQGWIKVRPNAEHAATSGGLRQP
jgi:hypothetical protein